MGGASPTVLNFFSMRRSTLAKASLFMSTWQLAWLELMEQSTSITGTRSVAVGSSRSLTKGFSRFRKPIASRIEQISRQRL